MDIADALQIVLDLAKQKIVTFGEAGPVENVRLKEACDLVEDMAVNQFGDDFERSPKVALSEQAYNYAEAHVYEGIINTIWRNGGNPNDEENGELALEADEIVARFFEIEPPQE